MRTDLLSSSSQAAAAAAYGSAGAAAASKASAAGVTADAARPGGVNGPAPGAGGSATLRSQKLNSEGLVGSDSSAKADQATPAETAQLKQSVASLNQLLQPAQGSIEFSVDEGSGKTLLKVVDTETNTVLLQIPSKQALALSQSIGQTTGVFIKDSA